MASEIKVDTISEKTSAGGVTIDGLLIKDGGISGDVSLIGTTPTFTIGDAGAEDAALVFDGNAKDFYIALDDSADKLVIGEGSTVGTNSILTITDDSVTIGDAAAVDTKIVFDGNAQDFYIGLDDSADDLVIGLGSAVGTTPAISINEDRDVTISDGAIDFDVASHDGTNGLKLAGTLVTTTAAELNLLDGGTSVGSSITIADADGFVVNDGGTMKTIPASDISTYAGGGLTAASQWRLTTSFTGDKSPIDANWEEVDAPAGFGVMGSSMTESSGIFTFPSTGYWLVSFTFSSFSDNNGAQTYTEGQIYTTTDNSTYAQAANPRINLPGNLYTMSSSGFFVQDVTNTSNDKVAFYVTSNGNGTIIGNTSYNRTYATFMRLGDT